MPSGWKLDSSTYLTDVNLICAKDSMPSYSSAGNMTGNQMADGYIRITVIEAKASTTMYVKINGQWIEVN